MNNGVVYLGVLLAFALMVLAPGFITWILIGAAIGLALPSWSKRFR